MCKNIDTTIAIFFSPNSTDIPTSSIILHYLEWCCCEHFSSKV